MEPIIKYKLKLQVDEVMETQTYDVLGKTVSSPYCLSEVFCNLIAEVFDMEHEPEEIFIALALDTKNHVVGAFEVSRGAISTSIVHPREVMKRLITCNAASFIVAHNHPSGSTKPSAEDESVTYRLGLVGKLIGIPLLDSLVVCGKGNYFSFKEDGEIMAKIDLTDLSKFNG